MRAPERPSAEAIWAMMRDWLVIHGVAAPWHCPAGLEAGMRGVLRHRYSIGAAELWTELREWLVAAAVPAPAFQVQQKPHHQLGH